MADGDAGSTTDGGSPDNGDGPTPQPETLRQQQRYAALAGSVVAGLAVTVSLLQRFPEFAPVWALAGLASGFAVYRLAARSVFPGEESTAERGADQEQNDTEGSAEPTEGEEDVASGSDQSD